MRYKIIGYVVEVSEEGNSCKTISDIQVVKGMFLERKLGKKIGEMLNATGIHRSTHVEVRREF